MAWRYGQSGSVGVGTVASMLTWQLQVEQEEIDTIIDRASQASCTSARGLSGPLSDSFFFCGARGYLRQVVGGSITRPGLIKAVSLWYALEDEKLAREETLRQQQAMSACCSLQ